ncbi:MAG: hypothetical protein KDI50_06910 [Candidatus Competibacteraceae bacterium]|nr:hypothetical protein [Candidatus Competibacteraceae bacterium]
MSDWGERIAAALWKNLRLEPKLRRQRLRSVGDGVDFLGYIHPQDAERLAC